MFPLCREARIGFMAFSPLAGGWLTGKYTRHGTYPAGSRMTLRPEPYQHLERAAVFDAIETLQRLAADRGVDVSALALAWVLRQLPVDGVVIGPRRPAHLDAALAAFAVELSGDEERLLSETFVFR
jgi:aryl-alcohol dehydrogenase-like predicted oxidoreductase